MIVVVLFAFQGAFMRIELKTDEANRVMLRIVAENDAERFVLSTFRRQVGEESLTLAEAAPVLAIGPSFLTFGTKPFPDVKLPCSLTPEQRRQVLEAIDVQTIAGPQEYNPC